jgi:hypothetical protein
MLEEESVQVMTPGLMALLRIFLAEEAVLDLKTRKKVISKLFEACWSPRGPL